MTSEVEQTPTLVTAGTGVNGLKTFISYDSERMKDASATIRLLEK